MSQQSRPGAGDFTGREKARSARAQAEALRERQGEISMVTAAVTEEEAFGVFDGQSGARLNETNEGVVARVVEAPEVTESERRFGRVQEPVFTGHEPFDSQEAPPKQRPMQNRALNPMVVIRVDDDIRDMTFGMRNGEPNNYNFKAGLQYRVPREVAEHLDERNLVRQWVSS